MKLSRVGAAESEDGRAFYSFGEVVESAVESYELVLGVVVRKPWEDKRRDLGG